MNFGSPNSKRLLISLNHFTQLDVHRLRCHIIVLKTWIPGSDVLGT